MSNLHYVGKLVVESSTLRVGTVLRVHSVCDLGMFFYDVMFEDSIKVLDEAELLPMVSSSNVS